MCGAHADVNPDPSVHEFAIAAGVPVKFMWDRRKGKEHNEILKGENVAQGGQVD